MMWILPDAALPSLPERMLDFVTEHFFLILGIVAGVIVLTVLLIKLLKRKKYK